RHPSVRGQVPRVRFQSPPVEPCRMWSRLRVPSGSCALASMVTHSSNSQTASARPGAAGLQDCAPRSCRSAADRFVTVVPKVDTPGHAMALVQLNPEMTTGRNQVEFELPPGHKHRAVWLDPQVPATFELIEEVLAGVAGIFPSPYIHLGADELRGMPTTSLCVIRAAGEGLRPFDRKSAGGVAGVGTSRTRLGRHHPVLV